MNIHTVEKISCSYEKLLVLMGPGYGRYQLLEREREWERGVKCTSQFPYKTIVYGLRPYLCTYIWTHVYAGVMRAAANTQLAGQPVDYRGIESGRHELIHFSASPTPNIESLGQAPPLQAHTHWHTCCHLSSKYTHTHTCTLSSCHRTKLIAHDKVLNSQLSQARCVEYEWMS